MRLAALIFLALLLCSCGGASTVPVDPFAKVYVYSVPREAIGGEEAHLLGYARYDAGRWTVQIWNALGPDEWGLVLAHELLHVVGLSADHGEPAPCLGASSITFYDAQLCEGDRALLLGAYQDGERHQIEVENLGVYPRAEEIRQWLNGASGGPLFTINVALPPP